MRKIKVGDKVKIIKNNGISYFDKFIGTTSEVVECTKGQISGKMSYRILIPTEGGEISTTSWLAEEVQLITKITNWRKELQ